MMMMMMNIKYLIETIAACLDKRCMHKLMSLVLAQRKPRLEPLLDLGAHVPVGFRMAAGTPCLRIAGLAMLADSLLVSVVAMQVKKVTRKQRILMAH